MGSERSCGQKGKKVLLQTFWSSSGWKSSSLPFVGEDFDYAKSMKLMFDPITIGHDELIQRLHSLHKTVTKERGCRISAQPVHETSASAKRAFQLGADIAPVSSSVRRTTLGHAELQQLRRL